MKVKPKEGNNLWQSYCSLSCMQFGTWYRLGAGYGISRSLNRTQEAHMTEYLQLQRLLFHLLNQIRQPNAISAVYNAVVSITTLTKGTANYGLYSVPYQAQELEAELFFRGRYAGI